MPKSMTDILSDVSAFLREPLDVLEDIVRTVQNQGGLIRFPTDDRHLPDFGLVDDTEWTDLACAVFRAKQVLDARGRSHVELTITDYVPSPEEMGDDN